ncbi:unnamed protein product [marine sediment metagenome]|uniref:Uncharacterized protein n=1 Tax=marine sediment metagenome TaxID=412755 RepID=X1FUQ5_9ZZZZ
MVKLPISNDKKAIVRIGYVVGMFNSEIVKVPYTFQIIPIPRIIIPSEEPIMISVFLAIDELSSS